MPEILADTADDLRRTAALAVTSLPGVARLEPTLTSALRSLQTATAARVSPGTATTYSAADGIRLTRRGNLVDIHVDITTTTTQAANITATAVRGALLTTIVAHQLTPGLITVTVLRLAT